MAKHAVVLFNLGGPDGPGAVRPFLFNLFNDPAIITASPPIRWLLARLISWRRAPTARAIYDHIGGASPLLALTRDQANALQTCLGDEAADGEFRVFIAMRYWHPFSDETAAAVKAYDPDSVVLLPLYPQFSTTTTGSSLTAWRQAAAAVGLAVPTRAVCCYPTDDGLIDGQAELIRAAIDDAALLAPPRILFSAHGLPRKIIDGGDPYAWQMERTAAAIADRVAATDWAVCYQSRVGPLEWIGPSIDEELHRAAADGVAVVVVPIAFVSEHSETLVELDIEYATVARELGLAGYVRVPALGIQEGFIDGLTVSVRAALERPAATCDRIEGRLCPATFGGCPNGSSI
jgi:ferrochelatase